MSVSEIKSTAAFQRVERFLEENAVASEQLAYERTGTSGGRYNLEVVRYVLNGTYAEAILYVKDDPRKAGRGEWNVAVSSGSNDVSDTLDALHRAVGIDPIDPERILVVDSTESDGVYNVDLYFDDGATWKSFKRILQTSGRFTLYTESDVVHEPDDVDADGRSVVRFRNDDPGFADRLCDVVRMIRREKY